MSQKLDVDNIISDINNVLLKHFNAIVNKYENDKNQFESFIKNIPIVKNIVDENKKLKEKVKDLEGQIEFLNDNLKSLGQHFNSAVFNSDVSFKVGAIGNNFENVTPLDISKENIELVINDYTEVKNTTETDIDEILEDNLNKKESNLLNILNYLKMMKIMKVIIQLIWI